MVVRDRSDADCSRSISSATAICGPPTSSDEVILSDLGVGLDQQLRGWDGIETIISFAYGSDVDGCEATYLEGGPMAGVPAFEVTPTEPSAPVVVTPDPTPTAPTAPTSPNATPGTSAANPIIVPNDPNCVTAAQAANAEIGFPSEQTLLFADESPSGLNEARFIYGEDNITGVFEQRPATNSCHVYFLPGIVRS